MNTAQTLIDKIEANGVSRYALSKATGVPDSTLSDIHAGKLGMSPKVAALLAEHARIDPRDAALLAIVESEKNPSKRERLARLLRVDRLAEAVRFELTEELPPRQFSRLQP